MGPGLSANVAIYVDGIIRPSGLTNNINFLDVDSVQVLKGPQGTLFGRNATGGAILVNSATPTFDPTVQGRVSYGRYNTVDTAVAGSTGLTDTLAASVSAFYQRSDGFVTNVLTGDDAATYNNYGVRAKLLYRPSDETHSSLLTSTCTLTTCVPSRSALIRAGRWVSCLEARHPARAVRWRWVSERQSVDLRCSAPEKHR